MHGGVCSRYLAHLKKRIEITSEEYEEIRIKFSNMLKEKYKNKENHPCYGIHLSEERKRKIGETNKGNKYCLGRIITDETKKKIGDANRNPREETRKKMSEARKGKKLVQVIQMQNLSLDCQMKKYMGARKMLR